MSIFAFISSIQGRNAILSKSGLGYTEKLLVSR
jgi:hypothetical protein